MVAVRGTVTGVFTDAGENSAQVTHYADLSLLTGAGTEYADYIAALNACTDIAMEQHHWSRKTNIPESNVTVTSITSQDQSILLFNGADGSVVQHKVPGFTPAQYMPDGQTVNENNATVADLISKILILIVTAGSAALIEYIRGWKKPAKKKATKLGVSHLNP